MTINLNQAEEIARRLLAVEARVLPAETREFDVGWVFYYQSAQYLDTGDFQHLLAGNAPIFVARSDGRAFHVSYHQPLEASMTAYRACGNPNAKQIPEVRVFGYRPGAQSVAAIQAIRSHSTLGLAAAKAIVEASLEERSSVVATASVEHASKLVAELDAASFRSEIRYES